MSTPEPNVFISWSGPLSKAVATALRDWLHVVVRDSVCWMSAEDIAKGSGWNNAINQHLYKCKLGIVVLTRENLHSPWVLFESGALFKAQPDRLVCTLLCDMKPSEVSQPLGQFQATEFNETDVTRLCSDIATAIGSALAERVPGFAKRDWHELKGAFDKATKENPPKQGSAAKPKQEETLEEIVTTLRSMQRMLQAGTSFSTPALLGTLAASYPTTPLGSSFAPTTLNWASAPSSMLIGPEAMFAYSQLDAAERATLHAVASRAVFEQGRALLRFGNRLAVFHRGPTGTIELARIEEPLDADNPFPKGP